jgi:hypothetical protein
VSRLQTRAAGVLAAVLVLATGCVDRPRLFEPVDPPAINMALPQGEIQVHERDSVRVAVTGQGTSLRAQLLLLDSAGSVLWRSALVPVTGGTADVPVEEVPATVERGRTVFMTGVVADGDGARYYASDDTVAAPRLSDAARRAARIWAGQRVRTADGTTPSDLTVDADRGRAYFPIPSSSAVGVLDLTGAGAILGSLDTGFRPGRVAYRAGVLAVLGESGGELALLRIGQEPHRESTLLPALELELDTTFLGAVRPTARGLAVGCRDGACTDPLALVPSALQVIEGSVGEPAAASVLRLVTVGDVDQPGIPALVLPGFASVIRGDTSAAARVYTPRTPDGNRAEVLRRDDASVCLATSIGGGVLAAGAPGVAYVVSPSAGAPVCGPGTGIIRLDGVGTSGVSVSALAIRNTMADDRIAGVTDLQVDDSGVAVIARAADAVLVLDSYLRVRGSVPAPDARAVAWLRGATGTAERFAVADAEGVTIYDAQRLTVVHRLPLGPTQGPLVFLARANGERVVAAPTAGGFVVASVPNE